MEQPTKQRHVARESDEVTEREEPIMQLTIRFFSPVKATDEAASFSLVKMTKRSIEQPGNKAA
jgi:hypothetical protein